MARTHKTIDAFLQRTDVALTNARSIPEILAALLSFGYDEARLAEGRALLEAALSRHAAQRRVYGEQYAATEALHQVRRAADEVYTVHRRLTLMVLKDDAQRRRALGLHEPKRESFAGWLAQAITFYANVLSDGEALGRFNITREHLEEGQALVQRVVALNSVREQAKYDALQATKQRDAALRELKTWLSEFGTVARIALADVPARLEALQIGAGR